MLTGKRTKVVIRTRSEQKAEVNVPHDFDSWTAERKKEWLLMGYECFPSQFASDGPPTRITAEVEQLGSCFFRPAMRRHDSEE